MQLNNNEKIQEILNLSIYPGKERENTVIQNFHKIEINFKSRRHIKWLHEYWHRHFEEQNGNIWQSWRRADHKTQQFYKLMSLYLQKLEINLKLTKRKSDVILLYTCIVIYYVYTIYYWWKIIYTLYTT